MLPGFRFLFAAILLSVSVLVFGVGAAALLRATHEEFVANPSWRNEPREQAFEPATPVLAVLRAEPVVTETAPSLRDRIPTVGLPADEVEPTAMAAADASSEPSVEVADTHPTAAPAEAPAKVEATVASPAVAPVSQPAAAETAAPPVADNEALTAEPAPPDLTSTAPSEPPAADTAVAPAPDDNAATKVAALPDPASTDKAPPAKAKATNITPDKAGKRRAHQSAKKRRRIARRPPPPPVQQIFDPFAQQQPAFATTAARTR